MIIKKIFTKMLRMIKKYNPEKYRLVFKMRTLANEPIQSVTRLKKNKIPAK
jgi:hypothetical protein